MGSELLNKPLPANSRGREDKTTSSFPYSDIFYNNFPYYLSIGMSDEQYWDKDPMLVKYYRKAEKLKNRKLNQQAWLQGAYIYDSLIRVAPLLHAFAKKDIKPIPYAEEPYPIDKESIEDYELREKNKNFKKGVQYMETFMIENNNKFKGKE